MWNGIEFLIVAYISILIKGIWHIHLFVNITGYILCSGNCVLSDCDDEGKKRLSLNTVPGEWNTMAGWDNIIIQTVNWCSHLLTLVVLQWFISVDIPSVVQREWRGWQGGLHVSFNMLLIWLKGGYFCFTPCCAKSCNIEFNMATDLGMSSHSYYMTSRILVHLTKSTCIFVWPVDHLNHF